MKFWLTIAALAALTLAARAEPPRADEERPPRPVMEEDELAQHPPPPGEMERSQPPIQLLMQHWKKKNPEEFERMQKLREEDPEAFRAELTRKLQEARLERGLHGERDGGMGSRLMGPPGGDFEAMPPEVRAADDKVRELARTWRQTSDEAQRQTLRNEMQKTLGEAFDRREQVRRDRLAQMEKKITELRSTLEQRTQKRDEIIQKRLQELTEGDKLAW